MSDIKIKYPNRLKEFRLKKLTQKEIVLYLNLTGRENRLSRLEKGIALPSVINFLKICNLYAIKENDVYKVPNTS